MTVTLDAPTELLDRVGEHLGTSSWRMMTQRHVDSFADVTGDDQWIHTDVRRASDGPFGTTIVHACLTLALAPAILAEVVRIREIAAALPIGLREVRFPEPLRVGARTRATVAVKCAEQKIVGVEATFLLTYEIEGSDQPVCVAEMVVIYP